MTSHWSKTRTDNTLDYIEYNSSYFSLKMKKIYIYNIFNFINANNLLKLKKITTQNFNKITKKKNLNNYPINQYIFIFI